MSKKILLLTPNYHPEPFPINIASEKISLNNFLTVVTLLPSYKKGKYYKGYSIFGPYYEKKGKIKIIRLPCIPRYSNNFFSIFFFYCNYFFVMTIFSIFACLFLRKKFSIVLTYDLSPIFTSFFGIILKKFTKIKHYSWIQDVWPEAIITSINVSNKNFFLKLIKKFQLFLWTHPSGLIAQSEPLANFLKKNKIHKKICTIHNPERLLQKNLKKKISNKKTYFSYFGNIGGAQNLNSFLSLFEHTVSENFKLNMFGDGKMYQMYKNKYKSRNIIWHGWKDEKKLRKYFTETDYFILPLKALNNQKYILPGKFTTYLSKFRPILGFSAKGSAIDYYIRKYKLGFFFDDKENRENKVKKLSELIKKKSNRRQYSRNTKKLYLEEFSSKIIQKKFDDLINNL